MWLGLRAVDVDPSPKSQVQLSAPLVRFENETREPVDAVAEVDARGGARRRGGRRHRRGLGGRRGRRGGGGRRRRVWASACGVGRGLFGRSVGRSVGASVGTSVGRSVAARAPRRGRRVERRRRRHGAVGRGDRRIGGRRGGGRGAVGHRDGARRLGRGLGLGVGRQPARDRVHRRGLDGRSRRARRVEDLTVRDARRPDDAVRDADGEQERDGPDGQRDATLSTTRSGRGRHGEARRGGEAPAAVRLDRGREGRWPAADDGRRRAGEASGEVRGADDGPGGRRRDARC